MVRQALTITTDTNVLLRAAVEDDPDQASVAQAWMRDAGIVAITTIALCEFAWVLRSRYGQGPGAIASSIRRLTTAENVRVERESLQSGLAFLDAGGDFADGVIAQGGTVLGGATFVSFDQKAIRIASSLGMSALNP